MPGITEQPRGLKNGDRGVVFDALQDLGGRVLELGEDIRASATIFPASHNMILDDLKELQRVIRIGERLVKECTRLYQTGGDK